MGNSRQQILILHIILRYKEFDCTHGVDHDILQKLKAKANKENIKVQARCHINVNVV